MGIFDVCKSALIRGHEYVKNNMKVLELITCRKQHDLFVLDFLAARTNGGKQMRKWENTKKIRLTNDGCTIAFYSNTFAALAFQGPT